MCRLPTARPSHHRSAEEAARDVLLSEQSQRCCRWIFPQSWKSKSGHQAAVRLRAAREFRECPGALQVALEQLPRNESRDLCVLWLPPPAAWVHCAVSAEAAAALAARTAKERTCRGLVPGHKTALSRVFSNKSTFLCKWLGLLQLAQAPEEKQAVSFGLKGAEVTNSIVVPWRRKSEENHSLLVASLFSSVPSLEPAFAVAEGWWDEAELLLLLEPRGSTELRGPCGLAAVPLLGSCATSSSLFP